jgi:hypothetical protein
MQERLESEIETLAKLIRQGKHQSHAAESYLKGAVQESLDRLQLLDDFASLPRLREILKQPTNEGGR